MITLDLISSLIANTHGKQLFHEYDAFTNDTQQEVFNLHQGQKIVFTVSGLSGKLIRWFICLCSSISQFVWVCLNIFSNFTLTSYLYMSVFIFNVYIDRGKFSRESILGRYLHIETGLDCGRVFLH